MLKMSVSEKNPDYALFGQLIGITPDWEGTEEAGTGDGEGEGEGGQEMNEIDILERDILLETGEQTIKIEPDKYFSSLIDQEKKEKVS